MTRRESQLLEMLKFANKYIAKAVADGHLMGCVIPGDKAYQKIAALIDRVEGERRAEEK